MPLTMPFSDSSLTYIMFLGLLRLYCIPKKTQKCLEGLVKIGEYIHTLMRKFFDFLRFSS